MSSSSRLQVPDKALEVLSRWSWISGLLMGSDKSPKTAKRLSSAEAASWVGKVVDCSLTVTCICVGLVSIWGIISFTEAGLIEKQTLKIFLSLLCPILTMIGFISPCAAVFAAVVRMSANALPTAVYRVQAACNVAGLAYALKIMHTPVLVTNMFGLGCQILFLTADHYVRANNSSWVIFAAKLSVLLNVSLCVCALALPLPLLGHIIAFLNVLLSAAPLSELCTVLRTRNAGSIPLGITLVSTVSCLAWSMYGLLLEDMVVLLPSVLGYILAAFEVLLVLWCRRSLPFDLSYLLLIFPVTSTETSGAPGLALELPFRAKKEASAKVLPTVVLSRLSLYGEDKI